MVTSYSLVTGLPGSTPDIMFPVVYTVAVIVLDKLLDREDLNLLNMSIFIDLQACLFNLKRNICMYVCMNFNTLVSLTL